MLTTDAFAAAILDHHLRGGASLQEDAYHLALTTDIPARDGTFTEIDDEVWTNYGRAEVDASAAASIFGAASSGGGGQQSANTEAVSFGTAEVTGGEPEARGFILMTAGSGGTGLWRGPLARDLTHFVGLATDNTIYAPGHGRANGHKVVFVGPDLPTGLTEGTPYWVIEATTDSFQVSDEPGGSAEAITADGKGLVGLARFAVVQDGNPVEIPTGDLAFIVR